MGKEKDKQNEQSYPLKAKMTNISLCGHSILQRIFLLTDKIKLLYYSM